MKICKIESHELNDDIVTVYYRIKKEIGTQKAYNRFKNYIRTRIGFSDLFGFGDRTYIGGIDYHLNVFRTKDYLHIVITMNKRIRGRFNSAMQFFDAIKNK